MLARRFSTRSLLRVRSSLSRTRWEVTLPDFYGPGKERVLLIEAHSESDAIVNARHEMQLAGLPIRTGARAVRYIG